MCLGSKEWIQVHQLRFFPRKLKRGRVRVLGLIRKRRVEAVGKDMEMENMKLYMENISIQEENDKLRKKASLLHQENLALMHEFQQRFSRGDFVSMTLKIMLSQGQRHI